MMIYEKEEEEEIGVTSWHLAAIKKIAKSFLFRRRKMVPVWNIDSFDD